MTTNLTDRLGVASSTGTTTVEAYGFTGLGVLASADEATIASAATTDVMGSDSLFNRITGTNTITSLGTATNRFKLVRFSNALILTHNATSLVLPGGGNITTAAGDTMIAVSDGSGNVRVYAYQEAGGDFLNPVTVSGTQTLANKTLTSPVLTSPALTSPVINTSVSGTAMLDEDDMLSNAADKVASQQSIKAYADSLSAIGKHTIWVPASAMTPATTNGPAVAQIETSTYARNYTVLDFDGSAQEYAHFHVQFPKSWDGGNLTFVYYWETTATDTDGVTMKLEVRALNDDEAADSVWGNSATVNDTASGTAGDVMVSSESSTIAANATDGELLFFRLSRAVSLGGDTMAEDARLIGVRLIYTTDAATDD